jgi:hypothetical protein
MAGDLGLAREFNHGVGDAGGKPRGEATGRKPRTEVTGRQQAQRRRRRRRNAGSAR